MSLTSLHWCLLISFSVVHAESSAPLQTLSGMRVIDFSYRLVSSIPKEPQNRVLSPLSIAMALNLLWLGSEGPLHENITHLMKNEEMNETTVHLDYQEMLRRLSNSPNLTFHVGNGVFIDEKNDFQPEFENKAKTYYNTTTKKVAASEAKTVINDFISDITRGGISNALAGLPAIHSIFVVNAFHFAGNWLNAFNESKTQKDTFYVSDSETLPVDMMERTGEMLYSEDSDAKMLRLDYNKEGLGFYIILANEPGVDSLLQYEKNLTVEKIRAMGDQMTPTRVNLKLPRMDVEYSLDLVKSLSDMGVPGLFQPGIEGLKGMTKMKDAYITDFVHRVKFQVDEQGSRAIGATMAFLTRTTQKTTNFTVNRPFIFFIYDSTLDTLILIAHIVKPVSD